MSAAEGHNSTCEGRRHRRARRREWRDNRRPEKMKMKWYESAKVNRHEAEVQRRRNKENMAVLIWQTLLAQKASLMNDETIHSTFMHTLNYWLCFLFHSYGGSWKKCDLGAESIKNTVPLPAGPEHTYTRHQSKFVISDLFPSTAMTLQTESTCASPLCFIQIDIQCHLEKKTQGWGEWWTMYIHILHYK